MINCNPETVSTDYDTSDRLYFEPLTLEDVLGVVEVEQPRGRDRPVRRPDAAEARRRAGGGRRAAARARASTRSTSPRTAGASARCSTRLGYEAPPYATAHSVDEALERRAGVGFPLLVRPSYVLGGRAMEIVYSRDGPRRLPRAATAGATAAQIFLDRFLENAIEVDVDALCDGERRLGRRDHAARRGGRASTPATSACVLPPHSLGPEMLDQIRDATRGIALGARRRRPAQRPVRRPRRARCT